MGEPCGTPYVYPMYERETPSNTNQVSALGERSRGHDSSQSREDPLPVEYRRGPYRPAGFAVRVPTSTLTPSLQSDFRSAQVSRDPWPLLLAEAATELHWMLE